MIEDPTEATFLEDCRPPDREVGSVDLVTHELAVNTATRHVRQRPDRAVVVELVEQVERREIEKSMRVSQNNKTRAADLLGISRFTLQRKLEKYGMT